MALFLNGREVSQVSKFTAGAKSELAGLMRIGQVTTATSVTIFESTDLVGQDDDAFDGWYVSVLQADNQAPEGEMKPMSDYVSSTGTITHTTFSQQLAVGDWVVLLRPEIAMLGAVTTSAATGAVTSTDFLMAYAKQIVTNTYKLAEMADGADVYPASVADDSLFAKILDSGNPADAADYNNTTDSLRAIRTAIDGISGLSATSVGVAQIANTTIDLNQAAATYDLFTGTSQAVILESLIIKMPSAAAGGSLTSISIQTDDATNAVFINSTDGDVGNLTSEAEIYWTGLAYITVATKIRLTIAGGANSSTYTCKVVAKCRAVVAGGNLA